jgi:hypothetical protein
MKFINIFVLLVVCLLVSMVGLQLISSGQDDYVVIESVTNVGNDVHVLATFHNADGSLINETGLNIKLVADGMVIYPFETEVDGWSPTGTYDFVIQNCVMNHYNNFTVSMIDYSGRYNSNSAIWINEDQQPGNIAIGGNATSDNTTVNININVGDANNTNIYYPDQNVTVIPQPDNTGSTGNTGGSTDTGGSTGNSGSSSNTPPAFDITTNHHSIATGDFVDDRVGNHTVIVKMNSTPYYDATNTTLHYTVEPHYKGVPMQASGSPLMAIFTVFLFLGGSLLRFRK